MTDFLDTFHVQPHMPLVVTSRIECETDGCPNHVTVSHDIDEDQAAAIVRAAGWTARMGARRWYTHCPGHAEVKR